VIGRALAHALSHGSALRILIAGYAGRSAHLLRLLQIPSFPVLGLALVFAGCTFSASAADPYADAPRSATSGGADGQGTGGSIDTGGTGDTGGIGGTDGATGATGGGAGTDNGAGGDTGGGGTGGSDAGMPPGSCQPATPPAICDPVKNLGCLVPFSFCDIDPTQAGATGRCVFPWASTPPPDGGGSCFVDTMTDTCTPTSTCVNGSCRKICYCDLDCQGGQCCTEPAPGSSMTFKLCAPC
jgi:hypothetical protein